MILGANLEMCLFNRYILNMLWRAFNEKYNNNNNNVILKYKDSEGVNSTKNENNIFCRTVSTSNSYNTLMRFVSATPLLPSGRAFTNQIKTEWVC